MESIVEKQLNYYNENDLENFIDCFHEEAEIYNFKETVPKCKGREAIKARYEKEFTLERTYAHLENKIIIGNKIIYHLRVSKVTSDTIEYKVAIYEIEDSLIKSVWFVQS